MKKRFKIISVAVFAGLILMAVFNQQKTTPPSQTAPSASPAATQPVLLAKRLTDEEKFILLPPSAEAPKNTLQKHAQTVAKLAQDGQTLEINSCQPTPLVLGVKQGSDLTIKNNDNINHRIILDEEHYYELPTKTAQTIKAQFKYGTGDYGYVCEGVGMVGFLHITP